MTPSGRSESSNVESPLKDDELAAPLTSTRRRTYDCIYCKRGFTTSQALGGHMNIHRRDKTRIRRSREALVSKMHEHHPGDCTGCYCPYSRIRPRPRPRPSNCAIMDFPAFPFSCKDLMADVMASADLRFLGVDMHLGMGLNNNYSNNVEHGQNNNHFKDEGGLDLELRLGH